MKLRLLDFLYCPACRGPLELEVFSHVPGPDPAGDVEEGILTSVSCGRVFPIIEGVPRLGMGAISEYRDFRQKHGLKMPADEQIHSDLTAANTVKSSKASFSREWHEFQYNGDKTFGWDVEERKSLFLKEMALGEGSLHGKTILDAGCGNGVLTSILAEFGLEAVGMDLSESVVRAHKQFGDTSVHFIQADVMHPPLKENAFDLIYSSGVLHHTPNTRTAFDQLTPLVNDHGRIYVWLYGTTREMGKNFWTNHWRGRRFGRFIRSRITSRLPLAVQHVLYIAMTAFSKIVYPVISALGIRKLSTGRWTEEMASIYDYYSAPYQHLHNDTEVFEWFETNGFDNMTVSESGEFGFGIYGDRRESAD